MTHGTHDLQLTVLVQIQRRCEHVKKARIMTLTSSVPYLCVVSLSNNLGVLKKSCREPKHASKIGVGRRDEQKVVYTCTCAES